jgi:hypothetical protein
MTITRTANQPITFPGQITAYDHDSTYTERTITSTGNQSLQFSEGKTRYNIASGTNPTIYTPA